MDLSGSQRAAQAGASIGARDGRQRRPRFGRLSLRKLCLAEFNDRRKAHFVSDLRKIEGIRVRKGTRQEGKDAVSLELIRKMVDTAVAEGSGQDARHCAIHIALRNYALLYLIDKRVIAGAADSRLPLDETERLS